MHSGGLTSWFWLANKGHNINYKNRKIVFWYMDLLFSNSKKFKGHIFPWYHAESLQTGILLRDMFEFFAFLTDITTRFAAGTLGNNFEV